MSESEKEIMNESLELINQHAKNLKDINNLNYASHKMVRATIASIIDDIIRLSNLSIDIFSSII